MKSILQKWTSHIVEKKEMRHIASVFIIDEKDRVLIILRSKTAEKNPNTWEIPGGHVDPEDKDYEASAVREAKEEVGLTIHSLNKLKDEEYHNRIKHYFVTDQYEGEIKIVANPETNVIEHSEYKWASIEDIEQLKQQSRVSLYLMKKAIKIIRGKK